MRHAIVALTLLALPLAMRTADAQVVCADCDGNSMVTILDALVGAQHAAGLLTLVGPQFIACDVDQSMAVNVLDALVIAQVAAGLPAAINCNQAPTCVVTAPAAMSMHTGDVDLGFDADDFDLDPLDLTWEWSSDSGATWNLCTAAAGSAFTNPDVLATPGAGLTFTWDAMTDVPTASRPVMTIARLTVDDGMLTADCTGNAIEHIDLPTCGSALLWTQGTPATRPSQRYYPVGAWDSTRSRFIVDGGSSGGKELWFYDPATGDFTQGTTRPGGMDAHHSAVYIPRDDCLFVYNGDSQSDFWKCDFSTNPNGVWTSPSFGTAINGHWGTMVWDAPNSRIIWAGSQNTADGLWELPIAPGGAPGVWNQLTTTGGSFGTRWGWRGDYDAVNGKMVCFYGNPNGNNQKVVAIDLPAAGPYTVTIWDPPSCPHGHWYDPVWFDGPNNDLYIFSGTYSGSSCDWVTRVDLDLPAPIFENMTMGMTNPPLRYGAAIARDPVTRTVYMFGGRTGAAGSNHNDVWEFCY